MGACAVQRVALGLVFAALFVVPASVPATVRAQADPLEAPRAPRFAAMPLDTPMVLTGTFGEARNTHFHAGLDLATGEAVGAPVLAPAAGRIVRVRSSGVGYGRSLYLQADDGRLLVFGHLDAFDQPIAGYVAAVQDSSGDYEQDLWPDSAAFPVRAGQRLGWSGRSGTGPPHLHFEVRRGDIALNPLFAGAEAGDAGPPVVRAITLEPLDGASSVEGRVAPRTFELAGDSGVAVAAPRRVHAHGRLRVIVEALDRRGNGRLSMAPYAIALVWRDHRFECRFDSVSWADGMAEVDLVYDRGRATARGSSSVVMWAPAGFRSRVVHTTEPLSQEAGVVTVDGGAETITVTAHDAGGREATASLTIEDERAPQRRDAQGLFGPVSHEFVAAQPQFHEPDSVDDMDLLQTAWMLKPGELRLESLPGGWVRVEIQGKRWREKSPRGLDFLGLHALDPAADRLAVLVRPDSLPRTASLRVGGDAPRWTANSRPLRLIEAKPGGGGELLGLHLRIPAGSLFASAVWALTTTPLGVRAPELAPVGTVYWIEPEDHPLRESVEIGLEMPARQANDRVGLYRESGGGWEFVRSRWDSTARRLVGDTRRLGRFALFRDTKPPRIDRLDPPRAADATPYSKWALEARLSDAGSGIEARACRFTVDGRRAPSEWDAEENVLRWRPLRGPAPGKHTYEIVAADRAGNVRRLAGSFVAPAAR